MLHIHCTCNQHLLPPVQSLSRMVVKADSAHVVIPELKFEIPPNTQKGVITTIEGLLLKSIDDLLKEQPIRKVHIN